MQVLPPGSVSERQNLKKLEKVALSHFFDTLSPVPRIAARAVLLYNQTRAS